MVQRLTKPMTRVLILLLEAGDDGCYGLELIEKAGLAAGTVYPMLTRLEEIHWVESRWEDVDPSSVGRPARRYYELTATGRVQAIAKLDGNTGGAEAFSI